MDTASESPVEKPSKHAAERSKIVISIQDKDGHKQFRVYTVLLISEHHMQLTVETVDAQLILIIEQRTVGSSVLRMKENRPGGREYEVVWLRKRIEEARRSGVVSTLEESRFRGRKVGFLRREADLREGIVKGKEGRLQGRDFDLTMSRGIEEAVIRRKEGVGSVIRGGVCGYDTGVEEWMLMRNRRFERWEVRVRAEKRQAAVLRIRLGEVLEIWRRKGALGRVDVGQREGGEEVLGYVTVLARQGDSFSQGGAEVKMMILGGKAVVRGWRNGGRLRALGGDGFREKRIVVNEVISMRDERRDRKVEEEGRSEGGSVGKVLDICEGKEEEEEDGVGYVRAEVGGDRRVFKTGYDSGMVGIIATRDHREAMKGAGERARCVGYNRSRKGLERRRQWQLQVKG
ncbi:hypothetical protein Tco_0178547 [Tanacetum coccineum]